MATDERSELLNVKADLERELGRLVLHCTLDAVRPTHVQRVVDEMLDNGRAARTVRQVHRIIHATFRDLVPLGVLRSNPGRRVKLPRLNSP